MNEQSLVDEIGFIKCVTENAQLDGDWIYDDDTRFVTCTFAQGGKNSVCEIQPALGRSTAALGQFLAMTRTAIPKLLKLAFRMQQENAALRAEVARLTAEVERLTKVVASVLAADQRTQEELKRCWRLDVSELERVKEHLAAKDAEIERLRRVRDYWYEQCLRLREAAERAADRVVHNYGYDSVGMKIANDLREALQPKETTNEQ